MGTMTVGPCRLRLPSQFCYAAFHSYRFRLFDFSLYDPA